MSDANHVPEPEARPAPSASAPLGPTDPGLAYEPPAPPAPYPTPSPSPASSLDLGYPATSAWGTPPSPPLQPLGSPSTGLVSQTERNWAVGAHLSGFLAAYLALGFLGPLVVLLTGGTKSQFVRRHAVEALNFNLTVLIAAVVSFVLVFVLIGIPMLIVIGILYLVAVIAGSVAASRGEDYHYPLSIRFIS
ncbi:MAG: uncharacterized protein QG622_2228 [Actinomycetota bacterium]|nr:uncharacterized protein [Actinomycetota bacterium]